MKFRHSNDKIADIVPKNLDESSDASRGYLSSTEALVDALKGALIVAGVLLAIAFLGGLLVSSIPDKIEASLSFDVQTLPVSTRDHALLKVEISRARALFKKIVEKNATRSLPYDVAVIDSHQVNAFAMLGGKVYLTSELLKLGLTDASLSFVLAHELAHHEGRHILKRIGVVGAGQLFGLLLGGSDGLSQYLATSSAGLFPTYSRAQEMEADDLAAAFILHEYKSLKGAEDFFQLLVQHAEQQGHGRENLGFFSTHPLTTDRIERLRKNLLKTP